MCEMEILDRETEDMLEQMDMDMMSPKTGREILNEWVAPLEETENGAGTEESEQVQSSEPTGGISSTKQKGKKMKLGTVKTDLLPGVELVYCGNNMYFGTIDCMTEELCDHLLSKNRNNRNQTKGKITQYKDAMLHGKWKMNGDTLQVSDKGVSISLQHRCEAWKLAYEENPKIKIPFSFSYGTKMADRSTTDNGLSQTLAHLFERSKKENARTLAGAVRLLWLRLGDFKVSHGKGLRSDVANALVKEHPGIETSCEYVEKLNKEHDGGLKPVLQLTYAAALHYLCLNCGYKKATKTRVNAFFEQIASGEAGEKDESKAGVAFYKKIVKLNSGTSKVTRDGKVGLFILSFLAFLEGETPKRLTLKDDDFPRVGGLDEEAHQEDEATNEEVAQEAAEEPSGGRRRRRKKAAPSFNKGDEVRVRESGSAVWRGIIEKKKRNGSYEVSVKGDDDGTTVECLPEHMTLVQ